MLKARADQRLKEYLERQKRNYEAANRTFNSLNRVLGYLNKSVLELVKTVNKVSLYLLAKRNKEIKQAIDKLNKVLEEINNGSFAAEAAVNVAEVLNAGANLYSKAKALLNLDKVTSGLGTILDAYLYGTAKNTFDLLDNTVSLGLGTLGLIGSSDMVKSKNLFGRYSGAVDLGLDLSGALQNSWDISKFTYNFGAPLFGYKTLSEQYGKPLK